MRPAAAIVLLLASYASAGVTLPPVTRHQVEAFHDKYGVDLAPAGDAADPWTKYAPLADADAARYDHVAKIVLKEFGLYPPAFVRAAGLKRIWLAKHLTVNGQSRAAVVLQLSGTLVIDVEAPEDRRYLRHCTHHEFYHLVELTTAGDFYFKDPHWAAFNPDAFHYGTGGENDQADGNTGEINHPKLGFVDHYATSGLEEDKAEVFACLMIPEESKFLDTWTHADPILSAKAKYLREFVQFWSKESPLRDLMAAVTRDDTLAINTLLLTSPGVARQTAWAGWTPLEWANVHHSANAVAALSKVNATGVDKPLDQQKR